MRKHGAMKRALRSVECEMLRLEHRGGGFGGCQVSLPGAHPNPLSDRHFMSGLETYSPNLS